jgi:hypothetical protein
MWRTLLLTGWSGLHTFRGKMHIYSLNLSGRKCSLVYFLEFRFKLRSLINFSSEINLRFHTLYFFHWLYSPLGLLIFSLMIILQTVGLLGRVISPSQGLYLNTGQHKHRINIFTYQTSMPCVGFEPMITISERAKTVHALDCSATVTGPYFLILIPYSRVLL